MSDPTPAQKIHEEILGECEKLNNDPTPALLKPCLFCGKNPQSKADTDPITYGWSIKCCGWVHGDNEKVSIEKWNSVYCWKVIAQNKEVIKDLLEAGKGYLGNGCEPTDGDIVHQPDHCRQCKLEKAIQKAQELQPRGEN